MVRRGRPSSESLARCLARLIHASADSMVASNATDGSGSRKALAPHCPRVPAHTTPRQALRKLRREPPSLRRKTRQRLRDQILHQRMAYPNGFCDLEPGPQITAHVALARGAVLGRSSRGAAASRRRSRGQRANLATIGLRVDDGSVENFSLSSKQCDPDRQIGQRLEVSRRIPDRDPLQRRLRPRRGR